MITMRSCDANSFQIRLIQESGLEPLDWIVKYAKRFREIVDSGIEEYERIRALIYH